ncbi:trans-aconitate 2-methyltransferase [bacterium BMS3Bbin10]|nr:trans-aconitate 2-methyltransferase [bacterium BMS3Bbin10]HDL17025.1 methyltransferase domain-containing protein [Hyphomicrobiales bacterium]
MGWDPVQYLAFGSERLQPALDLLARVPLDAPGAVVDLGCGPGNVTRALKARWPEAKITGVDGSPEMLARARGENPGIQWVEADMNDWKPGAPADLIYSNAALHWLDDHDALFPRLMDNIAPGGFLAVQMPRNWAAPSHSCITGTVRDGPWRNALEPLLRPGPSHAPDAYYDILAPRTSSLAIWETEYCQILEGDNPVAEFVKGTQLKRFLDALDEPLRGNFENEYRARILAAYPKRKDGKTLFPFRRLFLLAGK